MSQFECFDMRHVEGPGEPVMICGGRITTELRAGWVNCPRCGCGWSIAALRGWLRDRPKWERSGGVVVEPPECGMWCAHPGGGCPRRSRRQLVLVGDAQPDAEP